MSSDLATAAFNRVRDCVSLRGSWLQSSPQGLTAQHKPNARQSLSRVGKLQHTLGYGPYGYHTICRAVERAAQQCIQEDLSSLLLHLQNVQAKPEPENFYRDLHNALRMMQKIQSLHETQHLLLKELRERFFHNKKIICRWILIGTIAFEALKRVFRPVQIDPATRSRRIVDQIKHLFGQGPLGYFSLHALILQSAAQYQGQIAQPHLEAMKKVVDSSAAQQLVPVLTKLEEIEEQKQKLLHALQEQEWAHQAGLKRGCLLTAQALYNIYFLFKKPQPDPIALRSKDALLHLLLESDREFHPLWQAQAGDATWRMDFSTTSRCHQIKLYKNNSYAGHAIFGQDVVQEDRNFVYVLAITDWSGTEEAAGLLYRFLHHLRDKADTKAIRYDPAVPELPTPEK
jgi:hypothetical protein